MKKYLTIGQMSKLFKINAQTLHYYDSLGLLVPRERDTGTGYRKYAFEQVYQLATIRYLRKIGYSLNEIVTYMDYRNIEYTLKSLKKQSLSLRKQWQALIDIDNAIQRKIVFIELQIKNIDTSELVVKEFPDRFYISIGEEDLLYLSDSFYFYPTIAFYDKDVKKFGAYIFSDNIEEEKALLNNLLNISIIPKSKFLCGYHVGPYESINETVSKMRERSKELKLERNFINLNIIDQFVESNIDKYITEIQIPIVD